MIDTLVEEPKVVFQILIDFRSYAVETWFNLLTLNAKGLRIQMFNSIRKILENQLNCVTPNFKRALAGLPILPLRRLARPVVFSTCWRWPERSLRRSC